MCARRCVGAGHVEDRAIGSTEGRAGDGDASSLRRSLRSPLLPERLPAWAEVRPFWASGALASREGRAGSKRGKAAQAGGVSFPPLVYQFA